MNEKQSAVHPHDIVLKDRRSLSVTGVEEVIGCDEEVMTVKTVMGEMMVAGKQLHIGSFNRSTGELKIDGEIKELVYSDIEVTRRGIFSKLFR